jgi:hypothetical protein
MGEDGNGAKLRVAVNAITDGYATAAKMVSPNHWLCAIIVAVKSVTIAINDLFEFEGQPVPGQRPEAAGKWDMAAEIATSLVKMQPDEPGAWIALA